MARDKRFLVEVHPVTGDQFEVEASDEVDAIRHAIFDSKWRIHVERDLPSPHADGWVKVVFHVKELTEGDSE